MGPFGHRAVVKSVVAAAQGHDVFVGERRRKRCSTNAFHGMTWRFGVTVVPAFPDISSSKQQPSMKMEFAWPKVGGLLSLLAENTHTPQSWPLERIRR